MGDAAQSDPSLEGSTPVSNVPHAGLEPGYRDVVAGRYKLIEHIADGGMGSVFVAEHTLSRKKLAVKVVHPYLCRGRQGVERFKREVSAAATIDHPGIVQVYDAGTDDDGGFFMAMELLEGESLGDLLRRDWPGMKTAVGIVEGMLEPLAKAHAKGFIHRDLKPDNVFLAVDDEGRQRIKLLDFGLARDVEKSGPTRTGITFGTPEYMSPEQAMSARKVRAPGDVWAVGVMLYELLSGEHPFNGETPNAVMANAIKEPLPPLADKAPHVPPSLVAVIERALEKDPSDRPQTAGELLEELRAVTRSLTLDDTVPEGPTPPARWDEEEEDAPLVSSDLPVASVRRQAAIETEHMEAAPSSGSAGALPRSRLPLLLAGGLAFAVVLGVLVLWLYAGATDEAPAPVVTEEPEAPAEDPEPALEPEPAAEPPAPAEQVAAEEPPSPEAPEPSEAAAEPAPERPSPRRRRAAAEPPPSSGAALTEARACLQRNDRQCAISALRGRARSPEERSLLIGLYQEAGRIPQALDEMQSFVRRYPRSGRSAEYREILSRYGR